MSLLSDARPAAAPSTSERTPLLPLAHGGQRKSERADGSSGWRRSLPVSLLWRSVLVFVLAALLCVALLYLVSRYVVSSSRQVLKPSTDPRVYHYVELSNALPVLLISDPDTLVSAAAMSVGIGFYNDPSSVPGLAHFTEHMVARTAARHTAHTC